METWVRSIAMHVQVREPHAWSIIHQNGPLSSRWLWRWPLRHHSHGRIGFNTANPSLSAGKDFLIHSLGKGGWWIEWPYSTKTQELLGNPPLCPLRFSSTVEISLGHLGWISQHLPRFDVAQIQYHLGLRNMFIAFKGYQPSGRHHKFVGWSNSIVSMSWVGLSKDNRHSTTSETRGDMTRD